MWINRQSCFLLIQFKKQTGRRIWIPLALPVIETTLAAVRDGLEVWEGLFPNLFAKFTAKKKKLKPSMLVSACIRFMQELRKYKSYDLLHIDDGKIKITIRLI